jgi:hypothetical protein
MKTIRHENGKETNHCLRTAHAEQNAIVQAAKVVEAKYERSEVQGLAQRIGYALDIYLKIGEGVYN